MRHLAMVHQMAGGAETLYHITVMGRDCVNIRAMVCCEVEEQCAY